MMKESSVTKNETALRNSLQLQTILYITASQATRYFVNPVNGRLLSGDTAETPDQFIQKMVSSNVIITHFARFEL